VKYPAGGFVPNAGDLEGCPMSGDETNKRRRLFRRRLLRASVEISLSGCYGLAGLFAILSYEWNLHNVSPYASDPYVGLAVIFGLAGVMLSFVAVIAKNL
jgi:hypothetical protein